MRATPGSRAIFMSMLPFEIRPLKLWDEYLECERLQRAVWLSPDAGDVVPAHLLITVQKNGGVVLGAFQERRMAGFVFGFLGAERDERGLRFKHCSHMLGVLAEYRRLGLGFALKQKQREVVLQQGLALITWTYDPLQCANALLNLTRLGAIARRYVREAYGEMQDSLNTGISSDRFEVEWLLKSPRVSERAEAEARATIEIPSETTFAYRLAFDDRSLPHIESQLEPAGSACIVEIPADLHRLKEMDLQLARTWRESTRKTFENAFSRGWSAQELVNWNDEQGRARAGYLLKRD